MIPARLATDNRKGSPGRTERRDGRRVHPGFSVLRPVSGARLQGRPSLKKGAARQPLGRRMAQQKAGNPTRKETARKGCAQKESCKACGPGEKDGERGQAKAEQTRGDGAEGERPFAGKRGTALHTGAVLAEESGSRVKRAAFAGLQLLRQAFARQGTAMVFLPARMAARETLLLRLFSPPFDACSDWRTQTPAILAIVLWLRALSFA